MAQENEKTMYLLIHTHRFGNDVRFFKSKENYCGFYNGETSDIADIQYLINKLNLDVEFDRIEEAIDITIIDNNEIIDIDE